MNSVQLTCFAFFTAVRRQEWKNTHSHLGVINKNYENCWYWLNRIEIIKIRLLCASSFSFNFTKSRHIWSKPVDGVPVLWMCRKKMSVHSAKAKIDFNLIKKPQKAEHQFLINFNKDFIEFLSLRMRTGFGSDLNSSTNWLKTWVAVTTLLVNRWAVKQKQFPRAFDEFFCGCTTRRCWLCIFSTK